jgi:hypothetical protein
MNEKTIIISDLFSFEFSLDGYIQEKKKENPPTFTVVLE